MNPTIRCVYENYGVPADLSKLANDVTLDHVGALIEDGFKKYRVFGDKPAYLAISEQVRTYLDGLEEQLPDVDCVYICSESLFTEGHRPIKVIMETLAPLLQQSNLNSTPFHVVTGSGCANVAVAIRQFSINENIRDALIVCVESITADKRLYRDASYVLSDGMSVYHLSRSQTKDPMAAQITNIFWRTNNNLLSWHDGPTNFLRTYTRHSHVFLQGLKEEMGYDLRDSPSISMANYGDRQLVMFHRATGINFEQLNRPTLPDLGHIIACDTFANISADNRNKKEALMINNNEWFYLGLEAV